MCRFRLPAARACAGALGLAVLALLPVPFARAQTTPVGGPWVQTKDGYYATGRLAWGSSDSGYDRNGNVFTPAPEQKLKASVITLDSEYGISNRLTLRLAMPVLFQALEFPAAGTHRTNDGFGDLLFGFKYGFLDEASRAAVALEVDGNTPTGYNAYGFGIPSLGRGKFSVDGHLHAGVTLDPTPAYVQAEVGYRRFTNHIASDALTYGGEAGVFPTARVLVLAHLEAEKGRDDAKADFQSYTQAEGLVQYGLKPHLDVMAGYRRTLSGKNVPKRSELRLGVALKSNWLGRYRGQTAAGGSASLPTSLAPVPPPPPAATAPAPPASVPAPAPADTSQAPGQPR